MVENLLFVIIAELEFRSTMQYAEALYKIGDISKNEYLETIKRVAGIKDEVINKVAAAAQNAAKTEEES